MALLGSANGTLIFNPLSAEYGRRASSADDRCGRNTFSLDRTILIGLFKAQIVISYSNSFARD